MVSYSSHFSIRKYNTFLYFDTFIYHIHKKMYNTVFLCITILI